MEVSIRFNLTVTLDVLVNTPSVKAMESDIEQAIINNLKYPIDGEIIKACEVIAKHIKPTGMLPPYSP